MKKLNIKTIITKTIQRLRNFLDRTILAILTMILISVGFGIAISHNYVTYPITRDFPHKNEPVEIDTESYLAVRELWIEKEEKFEAAREEVFGNPFSLTIITPAEPINEEIAPDELENLLARNLFEFYQMRGEEMPLIPERALIWEELGLGSAQEYQGTHSQNMLLLRALMRILDKQASPS